MHVLKKQGVELFKKQTGTVIATFSPNCVTDTTHTGYE